MSRLRNFARGLASGYLVLLVNILYTLASIRLALVYLPKEEFGLWAVTLQIAAFLTFVDLGMSSSLARLLIDHKDHRDGGEYGGMLKSGMLVFLVQGLIILLLGGGMSFAMPSLMAINPTFHTTFLWLLLGQTLIVTLEFQTRIFVQVLFAHQRIDIMNGAQLSQFIVKILVLWLGFSSGWGVFSLLASHGAGWLMGAFFCGFSCGRLELLPARGSWGRASFRQFKELFAYGTDVFWVAIGTQLITSTQVIVVSRTLGLDAAAIWAVATKAFTLVRQVVWKFVGTASPMLSEMHARGEGDRLMKRFKELFQVLTAFAAWAAVCFAFCNQPFLELWTGDRVAWSVTHDWLLGFWLLLLTQQTLHSTLFISTKEIHGLRYAFFVEGITFLLLGLGWVGQKGTEAVVMLSVACTLCFTSTYCTWRFWRTFRPGLAGFFREWQFPTLVVIAVLVPLGLGMEKLLPREEALLCFVAYASVLGMVGGLVFLRWVLPTEWTLRFAAKVPSSVRPLFQGICGSRSVS